jgi:hypothetical protein
MIGNLIEDRQATFTTVVKVLLCISRQAYLLVNKKRQLFQL